MVEIIGFGLLSLRKLTKTLIKFGYDYKDKWIIIMAASKFSGTNIIRHLVTGMAGEGLIKGILLREFSLENFTECMIKIKESCEKIFPQYIDIGYKIREAVHVGSLRLAFFLCGPSNIGKYFYDTCITQTLNIPDYELSKIASNSQEKKLYISSGTSDIFEVCMDSFKLLRKLTISEKSISFLYCDNNENRLYGICEKGIIRISLTNESEEVIFEGKFSSFKYSQQEWLLGYMDGNMVRVDLTGQRFEIMLDSYATKLKYARSSQSILVIFSRSIWVMSLDLRVKRKYSFTSEPVYLFMNKEEKMLVVSLVTGKLIVIDNQVGSMTLIPVHTDKIASFYLDADTDQLTTLSHDSRIAKLSLPAHVQTRNLRCEPKSFVFNPLLKELIYVEQSSIKSWNMVTGAQETIFESSSNLSKCLDFNVKNSWIVFADDEQILIMKRDVKEIVKNFKMIRKISISSTIFDAEAEHVFSLSDENTFIYCYALNDLKVYKLKGHESQILVQIVINKAQFLVSGGKDCKIIVWDFKNEKVYCKFQAHTAAVTALSLTREENKIISGSRDMTVKVWAWRSTELLVTLSLSAPIQSLKVDSSNSLLSLSTDGQIIYWNLRSYTKLLSTQILYTINDFIMSTNNKYLYLLDNNKIRILEFPVFIDKFDVIGPNMQDKYEYIYYIYKILSGENVQYDERWNEWAVLPYRFNTMIFYSFANLYRHLKSCLYSLTLPVPSILGDPYSVATTKNCDKFLKVLLNSTKIILEQNPHSLSFITQKTIIELNLQGKNYLHHFYDQIMFKADKDDFPKFANKERLPIIILSSALNPVAYRFFPELKHKEEKFDAQVSSKQPLLKKNSISENSDIMRIDTSKVAICVFISAVRLELNDGSSGSISFLKSLLCCGNTEIFKTKFIQTLLDMKWNRLKKYEIFQSCCYLVFLIGFCVHLVVFYNTEYEWIGKIVVGVLAGLLFCYDLLQICKNSEIFFRDFWNYIDVLRIFLIVFYCFYQFDDKNYRNQFVSFIAFICFFRGILFFKLFNETRYIVQLIVNVIIDMKSFAIVLTYSILSFSMIQLILDEKLSYSDHLINCFLASTGDLRIEPQGLMNWILIIFMLIFNLIILMNMLISIMANTFTRVSENSEIADYMQITSMLLEVESILSVDYKNEKKKLYLQVCEPENSSDRIDQIYKDVKIIKRNMKEMNKKVAKL